jgi:hypothetical protein
MLKAEKKIAITATMATTFKVLLGIYSSQSSMCFKIFGLELHMRLELQKGSENHNSITRKQFPT